MGTESEHPAKKVTDAQLKAALQNICDQTGQPVARPKDIAEHESIDVGESAVNKRFKPMVKSGELAKLGSGSGAVYWLPEAGEGGEIDPDILSGDIINWESADPASAPREFIQKALNEMELSEVEELVRAHPEHEEVTRWDEYQQRASDVVYIGAPLFFTGFVLLLVNEINFPETIPFRISIPAPVEVLGALAFLAGMAVIASAVVVVAVVVLASKLEDSFVASWIGTGLRRLRAILPEAVSSRWRR